MIIKSLPELIVVYVMLILIVSFFLPRGSNRIDWRPLILAAVLLITGMWGFVLQLLVKYPIYTIISIAVIILLVRGLKSFR